MELRVRLDGPGADQEIRQLQRWISDERIEGHTTRLIDVDHQPDTLGAATTLLAIASIGAPLVDIATVAGSIAGSIVRHFRTRPPRPEIEVTFETPDGAKATIKARHLTDEKQLTEAIQLVLSSVGGQA